MCVPDDPSLRLPALAWKPQPKWCADCKLLETPWATTDAERENAVNGSVRALGTAPDWLRLGMYVPEGGITGTYDSRGLPIAGVYVRTDQTCGRLSSFKFSRDGMIGAHLLGSVRGDQLLFQAPVAEAASLFISERKAFVWPSSIVSLLGINEMWFSRDVAAIDLSGNLWLADLSTQQARAVNQLPGAPSGSSFDLAEVVGKDVFVSRWVAGRSEWWVVRPQGLIPFLSYPERDVKQLLSDGQTIVWLEGRDPQPPPANSSEPTRFQNYSLYKAPYTADPAKLVPELLASGVPPGWSSLVFANGHVAGNYLVSYPVYRAAAFVVRVSDGRAMRFELPDNYSWGFELFPTATEMWGAVTPGPMIKFETVARVPYTAFEVIQSTTPSPSQARRKKLVQARSTPPPTH